jgi:hypothetical protein
MFFLNPFKEAAKQPKLLMWCLALHLIQEIQNWIFDTESRDPENSDTDGFFFGGGGGWPH